MYIAFRLPVRGFDMTRKGRFHDEILALTKKLVSIPSVSPSSGELDIADFIYKTIQDIPYFQQHPGQVFMRPLRQDALRRKNVFALLRGTEGSDDTIICHGHMDTVNIDDFGPLKAHAFVCDDLPALLSASDIPDDVRRDLESGDWLFGRGSCDMKSGDAVFLVLMNYLAAHRELIRGNIFFMFNCDEECENTGMVDSVPVIEEMKDRFHIRPVLAINDDYVGPLYQDDPHRYVYTGTVGKILAAFYVLGIETHVGRIYEGVSASGIAARLIDAIDMNPDLCDDYDGEFCQPPALLKMRDLKTEYNVQTSQAAFIYFNYLIHDREIPDILDELKEIARRELQRYLHDQDEKFRRFCERTSETFIPSDAIPKVYSYEEFAGICTKKGIDIKKRADEIAEEDLSHGMDKRDISQHVVEVLCDEAGLFGPAIILFLAPPYCPHNTLHKEIPREAEVCRQILQIVSETGKEYGEDFRVRHFFPCLSDSSYVKIDDSSFSVETALRNFPAQEILYPLPLHTIEKLNIPAVNMGVYGKDCHTWTERLYMPYSFDVLPELLLNTFAKFLK